MSAIDSGSSYVETLSSRHLTIGCFVFPRQDQIDFTGPFEVCLAYQIPRCMSLQKRKIPFVM